MSNNPLLFNAMIAGATGGCQQRCITNAVSSTYLDFEAAVLAFCTALDADISTLDPPASMSDAQLMQSLCAGVLADRMLVGVTTTAYAPMIDAIRTLFTLMRADFDGSGNPNGGWDLDEVAGLTDDTTLTAGAVVVQDPTNAPYIVSITDVLESDYIKVEGHFIANRLETNTSDAELTYSIEVRYDGGTWITLWTTARTSFPAAADEVNYIYCPINLPKTQGNSLVEPVPAEGAALAEFRMMASADVGAFTLTNEQGAPDGNFFLSVTRLPGVIEPS